MNSHKTIQVTLAVLGLAIAGAAGAQQSVPLPVTHVDKAACADFQWSDAMLRERPRLANSCQEVVAYNGVNYARLSANFKSIDRDGTVNFDIQDQRNRILTDVSINPRPGQVVYIDNGTKQFSQLRTTDVVNLYVPEHQYGFSMRPGVAEDELAYVQSPPPAESEAIAASPARAVASQPTMLPQTASKIPLLALGGLLSLFGGLALTLVRRRRS